MFGYVSADMKELSKEQKARYTGIYCGICRQIRLRSSRACRMALSYDMAFLAMLLMSLYEPEETSGSWACGFHLLRPRPWIDNEYIRYSADMNVALAYYKSLDDYADEGRRRAKRRAELFGKYHPAIARQYPRQCAAIADCIQELSRLEKEGCSNPDLPAACFGKLMGELFVYKEDFWAPTLRQLGMALGRFIYLADAATDYREDKKQGRYNPFLAKGMEEDWQCWEEYLVLYMARCSDFYEKLPLVQDKAIMDNVVYSGVWLAYHEKLPKQVQKAMQEESHD